MAMKNNGFALDLACVSEAFRNVSRGTDEHGEHCYCVGEYVGQRPVPGRSHDAECTSARLALRTLDRLRRRQRAEGDEEDAG